MPQGEVLPELTSVSCPVGEVKALNEMGVKFDVGNDLLLGLEEVTGIVAGRVPSPPFAEGRDPLDPREKSPPARERLPAVGVSTRKISYFLEGFYGAFYHPKASLGSSKLPKRK